MIISTVMMVALARLLSMDLRLDARRVILSGSAEDEVVTEHFSGV